MGNPILWNGSALLALKSHLKLNDQSEILSGTVDPSSSATAANAGSLYLNSSSGTLYRKTDNGSSTNWEEVTSGGGGSFANSEIWLIQGNGYGSTATKIRRWVTVGLNTGSDMTLTQDASNGDSVTINTDGVYAISYTDQTTASGDSMGISVNSNQLTTNLKTITSAHRRIATTTPAANRCGTASASIFLSAGDVVRAHSEGTTSGTETTAEMFRIVRVR